MGCNEILKQNILPSFLMQYNSLHCKTFHSHSELKPENKHKNHFQPVPGVVRNNYKINTHPCIYIACRCSAVHIQYIYIVV